MSRQNPGCSSRRSPIFDCGSPVLKPVQPSCITVEPSRNLKRKRQSIDEEDIENAIPPIKQSKNYSPNYSSEAKNDLSVSPVHSFDEGCSSVALEDILDDRVTSCADSSSDESSPLNMREISPGVLSPLNDNFTDKENGRTYDSNKNRCPLPPLPWADPNFVWMRLCERDSTCATQRSANMLDNHPSLKPRMRAILLDWINEVSEVYKLRRETYHLCIYYLDRYLTNTDNINKNCLQLIGITCLFIASKVEEIYPPKINDLAYVTDGACTAEDILEEELSILKVLNWSMSPITCYGWLNMYLQLSNEKFSNQLPVHTEKDKDGLRNYAFLFSQYSSLDFVICIQLIDLALLHVESNAFKYSQLTAASIAHCFNKEMAIKASGYEWKDISACFLWLKPFVLALKDLENFEGNRDLQFQDNASLVLKVYPNINPEQSHRVQTHNISMDMFDKAEDYKKSIGLSLDDVFSSDQDLRKDMCVFTPGQLLTDSEDLKEDIPILTPPDSSHKKHMKNKLLRTENSPSTSRGKNSIKNYMTTK